MSRTLWFAAGASAGIYAAARARRAAEALTIDGLRDRAGAAVVGLRLFRDEVAQGRAAAETDLRDRMGLALHEHGGQRELPPGPAPRPHRDPHDPPHDHPHDRDRPAHDTPLDQEAGSS